MNLTEHTVMLEIAAHGDLASVCRVVQQAADRLMEDLLAAPDVDDPSIMVILHADADSDADPEIGFIIGGAAQ